MSPYAMKLTQLKRGFGMSVRSLVVLKRNPKLLIFPLFAGISSLAFLALLVGSTFGAFVGISGVGSVASLSALDTTISANPGIAVAALFAGYLGTTFVSVFFTGALVAESRRAFAGESVDLRRGMARAWDAKYKLLAWAVIAATVGILIDAVEGSDSPVSQVFAALFGIAWTIITFFVVPVAVLDSESTVREMFSRSGRTFRENIGETVIGLAAPRAIGGAVGIVTIGIVIVLRDLTSSALVLGAILVGGLILAQLLSTTIRGILKTLLYVYATAGEIPEGFDPTDLDALLSG
jgi:hypothetical protein